MTARHPIKLTSPRCHSAWQPNRGRRSTYRRGKTVQTTETTSGDRLSIILIDGRPFSFGTPITLASGAKLTINADGSFQYDQNGSFTHLSAGQTVNDIFTYTISDGRGGTDTSAVCMTISGVGGTVIDDTPSIGTPTAALAGELTLDESAVGTDTDGGDLPVGVASVTANFADNFAAASPSYGADGAGSTSLAFVLTSEGLGSGLYALDNTDTTTGDTAVLPDVGPTWHVAGAADFNGDGKSDILWHHDSGVTAIWTMDATTITAGTVLPDVGPTRHVAAVADFNGDAKADILWQHDSGLPSIWTMVGTTDTDGIGQGDEILLYVSADGTTVTGSTAATEAGITAANTYFTITVDNNPASPTFGDVTFTQTQNIWHDDTNDPDDPEALTTAAAGDLTLTLTVTDADGDRDSASINLGAGVFVIQDDGPAAVVIGTPAAIVLDETRPLGTDSVGGVPPTGVASATGDFSANFAASNFGTDGASSARYALVLTGASVASGLFALDTADTTAGDGDGIGQGASIVLNKVGNDILGQVGAVTYFTISVGGNGVVTFTQLENIWHPNTGSNDEAATLTLSRA